MSLDKFLPEKGRPDLDQSATLYIAFNELGHFETAPDRELAIDRLRDCSDGDCIRVKEITTLVQMVPVSEAEAN